MSIQHFSWSGFFVLVSATPSGRFSAFTMHEGIGIHSHYLHNYVSLSEFSIARRTQPPK